MLKLKDSDIRNVLLSNLDKQYKDEEDTKVVNEMGVLHGQSRVDVAVINGILHGYEIKSESDNLERLPSQMNDYNKVFDRMTIVVQRKYLDEVRKLIPKWWGIMLVTRYKGELHLREIRKGRVNKSVDPFSLSHLLWRGEAIDILKEKGLQKGYLSKPRHDLYEKICNSLPLDELQTIVNQRLKMRGNWRAH
ncbi:sce7726 family protein [Bacillus sp. 95MFCvi2.1]|uniref:sce7726 family protein n=1 Tax=Bacillus sp. 95MFCvi2.1 TaxID=1151121 RepID=UPI000375FB81|nr:sce7726 family protein [Bacillus sp. 95MFCvi2.1]